MPCCSSLVVCIICHVDQQQAGQDKKKGAKPAGAAPGEGKKKQKKQQKAQQILLPWCGQVVDTWCKAIGYNEGLYTQCQRPPLGTGETPLLCKGCSVLLTQGRLENGMIEARVAADAAGTPFASATGKVPKAYAVVAKKRKWTQEVVEAEAAKYGLVVDTAHFVEVEARKKPAQVAKAASASTEAPIALERPADFETLPWTYLRDLLTGDAVKRFSNKRVLVKGWVDVVRQHGKLSFIELRDGTGYMQCVFKGAFAKHPEMERIMRETSVVIVGEAVPANHADIDCLRSPLEVSVEYFEIVGDSDPEYPNIVPPDSGPAHRLDQRHLVLRSKRESTILKLRSFIVFELRKYFYAQHYHEMTPPTLVQTQVEGGSTLFPLNYYGGNAFLTQSSQLYLETVIPSFGDVFCMLSSYRAEKSRTRRHLSEYMHCEAECPFITFTDLLDRLEHLVRQVYETVVGSYRDLLRVVNPTYDYPAELPPFKRMQHCEAIDWLNEHGVPRVVESEEGGEEATGEEGEGAAEQKPKTTRWTYGDDIPESPERFMVDTMGVPVLLHSFPTSLKPFYMARHADDESKTESVDVLVPGVGEIVGGSMRQPNLETLMAAYKTHGLNSDDYYWFNDQRKYGTVPHGGYGLGVERLVVWLLRLQHINEVCMYPRFYGRCKP